MVVDVMAATKSAHPARQVRTPAVIEERFESQGRAWLWREGATLIAERYRTSTEQTRDEVRALFLRKLAPAAEKRGITAEPIAAATPAGVAAADVRWMRWYREGEDPAPLWALFVQSRVLSTTEADNDTWNLVAWGDGPALAWASTAPVAQDCLRAALRVPPAWLHMGMASRDPAFCVRIERFTDAPRARKSGTVRRDTSASRDSEQHESSAGDKPSARSILTAWRKAHPARSAS